MNWEKKIERALLCGSWRQEVGIGGDDKSGRKDRIRSRIGKVARVIGVLNEPIWKREELSRRTKLGL